MSQLEIWSGYPIKGVESKFYVFDPDYMGPWEEGFDDGGYIDDSGVAREIATWFRSLGDAEAACVKSGRTFVIKSRESIT